MDKNNYDEAIFVSRRKNKGITSTTKVIAFYGEAAEDVTLFVSKVCSLDSQVLIVDLSYNKKLFLSTIGDVKEQAVTFRKVCYTYDMEYFTSYQYNYDMVLIYSDFVVDNQDVKEQVEYVYLNFGIQKFSLLLLEKMYNVIDFEVPYALICRGTEKKAEKQLVNNILQMLCIKKNKPEYIYYVPNDMKDMDSLIRYEYGVLDISELSQPMYNVVIGISEHLRKLSGKSLSYVNNEGEMVINWIM